MSQLELAKARARALAAKSSQPSQPPAGMFMNPETGQMTSRELLTNALPTSRAGAASSGYMQGYSLDTVDEAAGAIGGDFERERARAQFDANARDYPGTELTGRVVGAVTSPLGMIGRGVKTIKGGMGLGGAFGAVEGFNSGEGSFKERLPKAAGGAATGGLFAGISSSLTKGASKGVQAIFARADERPTVDTLKAAKNAAYAAVKKAGVNFDNNDMLALNNRIARRMQVRDFDEAADPQTAAAMRIMERRKDTKLSLNRLDRLRQNLWDRYSRSDEPGLLDMISEIDATIAQKAKGNELLQAARAANSKFAKAQLLENAFRKARLQTASTGSGGNILNKYRQAVTRIVTTPREAKWFSDDEIALMESFIEGDNAENTLRRIGKLSPGGNGLMTALNVYAAAVDPTMLAVSGVATAAKETADRSAMRGSEQILDAVSTGVIRQPRSSIPVGRAAIGSAAGGNALLE